MRSSSGVSYLLLLFVFHSPIRFTSFMCFCCVRFCSSFQFYFILFLRSLCFSFCDVKFILVLVFLLFPLYLRSHSVRYSEVEKKINESSRDERKHTEVSVYAHCRRYVICISFKQTSFYFAIVVCFLRSFVSTISLPFGRSIDRSTF